MQLADLQRAFQARILDGRSAVEAEFADADAADFAERVDVYVRGYRTRLVEALATTYPALKAALGEAEFESRMTEFINASPSRHYSVRYYGGQLGGFLAGRDPSAATRALGELAHWEWALAEVFDAADDVPATEAQLAALPADAWGNMRFSLRASVRRQRTTSNAVEWWRVLDDAAARPAKLESSAVVEWVLWRRGLKSFFKTIEPIEAAALDAVAEGSTFSALCERIAATVGEVDAPLKAATLLRGWFSNELLTALDLSHYRDA